MGGLFAFDFLETERFFAFAFFEDAGDLVDFAAEFGEEVFFERVDAAADFFDFLADELEVAFEGRAAEQLFDHLFGALA